MLKLARRVSPDLKLIMASVEFFLAVTAICAASEGDVGDAFQCG